MTKVTEIRYQVQKKNPAFFDLFEVRLENADFAEIGNHCKPDTSSRFNCQKWGAFLVPLLNNSILSKYFKFFWMHSLQMAFRYLEIGQGFGKAWGINSLIQGNTHSTICWCNPYLPFAPWTFTLIHSTTAAAKPHSWKEREWKRKSSFLCEPFAPSAQGALQTPGQSKAGGDGWQGSGEGQAQPFGCRELWNSLI